MRQKKMLAKIEYCDGCSSYVTCMACHLPEMGGMEGWFCKECREALATETIVERL